MTDSKKKHRIQCKGRPVPQQYKEIKAPKSSHTLLVLILLHPTCNLTTLQQECIVKPQLVLLVFLGAAERYLGPKQSCPPCWPGPHAGLPWQEHASRQMFTPLQRTSPPGAEGGFSDAHAITLLIFVRLPAAVAMIFISISALFICRFQGMFASCVWQPTLGCFWVWCFYIQRLKLALLRQHLGLKGLSFTKDLFLKRGTTVSDLDILCPKVRFFPIAILFPSSNFVKWVLDKEKSKHGHCHPSTGDRT